MTPTFARILHPTDFDPGAHRALSLAALLARKMGAELHVLHVDASAARAVLDYAAERDITLIVMGAKRLHTGFGHLLGSVAREVVDGSSCPVLATRQGEAVTTPQALSRVLVPYDFSAAARQALAVAADVVRQSGGELVLLHVLEPQLAAVS